MSKYDRIKCPAKFGTGIDKVYEEKMIFMSIPGKQKGQKKPNKEVLPEKEKDWENPKNPEGTHDERDVEQLQRQLEEAERRKQNLTDDKTKP